MQRRFIDWGFASETMLTHAEQVERSQATLPFARTARKAAQKEDATAAQCPLCGCGEASLAFRDNDCSLRRCGNCELFFVDPYPTRAQQHHRVSSGCHSAIEILDCVRRYAGERFYYDRHFAPIGEECQGANSLLDVGCGTGHLLERLGYRPNLYRSGIELNPEAAAFARRVARCEILQVPLEEFRATQPFDVITMINVFSHIPSFDAMFASVCAALRPAGKLILRTTEMSQEVNRWNQLHWGVPDDLHFLGLRTLEFVCAKYGFTVSRHIRTPYEDELFRASRWRQMGRDPIVNVIKRAGARLPGLRAALRRAYSACLGRRLFVSFIVLKPNLASEGDDLRGR